MFDLQTLLHQLVILALPMLVAVTVHELAHGVVADRLGDPTARMAGRLTLNPLSHLDLWGTLTFVVTQMIGWAKPVPVDPGRFGNPRRDMIWVSLAGPVANFAAAAAFAVGYRLLVLLPGGAGDGLAASVLVPLVLICRTGVVVNLGLGLFNLIPVPPLDGSRVLRGVLPLRLAAAVSGLERYGLLLVLLLVFSGVLEHTLFPALRLGARLLLGV